MERVGYELLLQEITLTVTHYLVNFYDHAAVTARRDLERLDMRINDCPLTLPIAAHLIASVDVTTFHSVCPSYIGVHGREDGLDVALIEQRIDPLQEFHFFRHLFSLSSTRGGSPRAQQAFHRGAELGQMPTFLHGG